jgi:hypothetical protein
MNKIIWCVLAGALGGGVTSVLAVAILQVQVLMPERSNSHDAQVEERINDLDARLTKIELNSGQLDDKERPSGEEPNPR